MKKTLLSVLVLSLFGCAHQKTQTDVYQEEMYRHCEQNVERQRQNEWTNCLRSESCILNKGYDYFDEACRLRLQKRCDSISSDPKWEQAYQGCMKVKI